VGSGGTDGGGAHPRLTGAIANEAIVLTADRDHDHIAAAVPDFRHEFLPEE